MLKALDPKIKVALIASLLLYMLAPLLVSAIKPNDYKGGRSRDELAKMQRNSSAIANIVGEFRASVSDIIFIKTERYLHGGIAYDAHVNMGSLSIEGEVDNFEHAQEEYEGGDDHDDHHDHGDDPVKFEDEGTSTLIPTKENDFRGFIGHLERNIRPWVDPSKPHVHTDGTELLPWYRIMTISDPNNVRAYIMGGWWLFREGKEQEGYDFINEGLENNPDAFQLPYYKGRWQLSMMRQARTDFEDEIAANYEEQAINNFRKAADLVFETRPETIDYREIDFMGWSDYMEDDATGAVRLLVLMLRNSDQLEEALQYATTGADAFRYYDEDGNLVEVDGKLVEYRDELQQSIGVAFPLAPVN